jgi:hypothetical protein
VLYELLTGERAFSASSSAETLTTIVRDDPPRLAELAGTSPELARLLRRCLETSPSPSQARRSPRLPASPHPGNLP